MGTDTWSQSLCRGVEGGSRLCECLHQISPLRVQWRPWKRRWKEYNSQRGWRTPRECGLLNQLSKAYKNAQKLKQQTQSLQKSAPGPPLRYYSFHFCTFMGLLSVWMSESLIFVSSLGALSFVLVCLVQLQYDGFCFLLFITLYSLMFCCYLLEACSFLMRDRKGLDPDGRGSREELGWTEGEKTVTRICRVKKSIFSKRRK